MGSLAQVSQRALPIAPAAEERQRWKAEMEAKWLLSVYCFLLLLRQVAVFVYLLSTGSGT